MPLRAPFTQLCRIAAQPAWAGRADLHMHSTFSDGVYSPSELVDLARRSGLRAIALTDHDTTGGIEPATAAANGAGVEVVPGVEITAVAEAQEIHLLGYFFDPNNPALKAALDGLREARWARFQEMVGRLSRLGVGLPAGLCDRPAPEAAVGRRNLAEVLVKAGKVSTIREAFSRYLGDGGRVAAPTVKLEAGKSIELLHGAGGVAALAHPSYDCDLAGLRRLAEVGLDAVEVEFPGCRESRTRELRQWASQLGLAITGGSDCHGPGPIRRSLGSRSVRSEELEQLRSRSGR